jgi:hypothetical protein
MKRILAFCLFLVLSGVPALASSLGTSTRNAIPYDVQQIICVDYRSLRNSPAALALKDRVLPDNLKQFETALRGVGVADQDVEQLTFVSFRADKALRIIGIATGQFQRKAVLRRIQLKKIKPAKYHDSFLYPMASGMQMTFLDDWTLLFGDVAAVKSGLDARDGDAESLNANTAITDMIGGVDSGPVWSVLDADGTQNMMRSTLGDAAKLADYETIRTRLLGSRYQMGFSSGVTFDLDVITPDSITASGLSALVKAGVMYRRMSATGAEKVALDSVTVDSDSAQLKLHFKTDDKQFQALLHSDLFAAVSR